MKINRRECTFIPGGRQAPRLVAPGELAYLLLLVSSAPPLEDGQDFQNVEEEIHDRNEQRNRKADRIRQGVGHVFGALHVVEDVAAEDGDAEDRDEQSEAYTMEENAHNARAQQQEQPKEQVIAQAREVAFGGP